MASYQSRVPTMNIIAWTLVKLSQQKAAQIAKNPSNSQHSF